MTRQFIDSIFGNHQPTTSDPLDVVGCSDAFNAGTVQAEPVSQQLQIDSDLNEMETVLTWFEQFHQMPLTDEIWLQARLALVEGFTNVVRHAHQHLPQSTPILIQVAVSAVQLEMRIWDEGVEFCLEALIARADVSSIERCDREAHWGSILWRKLCDNHGWVIQYHGLENSQSLENLQSLENSQTGRNCLVLCKGLG
jgi:serine/threonine-protein kinase RsbW